MQEVSGVHTSPFLHGDERKMTLQARNVSGAFENRVPGTTGPLSAFIYERAKAYSRNTTYLQKRYTWNWNGWSCQKLVPRLALMPVQTICLSRAFSIYQKFRKISIRNFRLEKRVPFATTSIRGSRGTHGHLKDRERYGTGDKNNKDETSVNGTQISIGQFPPGKRDYRFRSSVYSGKVPVERTKKSCSIYIPTAISRIFW